MVRGLDYYTKTTFEFVHDGLGAQSGIGGGGRYDGLMEQLGGQALSGIGFGIGVDRTMLAMEAEGIDPAAGGRVDVYGVALGAPAKAALVPVLAAFRRAGLRADMAYGDRGMKGAFKAADRSGAAVTVVLGEDELAAGTAVVKTMATGEQHAVPLNSVVDHVAAALAS
jgi:histidyl-tRNA synthetase